ncbi:MAG: hypothetical protein N2385_01930 [Chloroflexus sp.]|nr:hypothetical protein [Chloroflexus sp.]
MSSIVAVKGSQGFIISSDSIVFKYATDQSGAIIGKIKGATRKLFQIHDDILVVGLGNWDSYFPMFNSVASLNLQKNDLLNEIRNSAAKLTDARVYVFSRQVEGIILDIIENGQVQLNRSGAVMYPEKLLNSLFLTMYESEHSMAIRKSGMLGIAALVNAYNAFASSLCSDIAAPFDTVLFTPEGTFNFSGGVTRLPTGNFS